MISRKGTRRSGAASGEAKIFRDEGSGPVVTAGTVLSGLERMFMGSSVEYGFASSRAVRHPEVRALASLEGWSRAVALRGPLKRRPPPATTASPLRGGDGLK